METFNLTYNSLKQVLLILHGDVFVVLPNKNQMKNLK